MRSVVLAAALLAFSGCAYAQQFPSIVATQKTCHGWFCETVSLDVFRIDGAMSQAPQSTQVAEIFGPSAYNLVEQTSIFTAYDPATKTVYLWVFGGPVAQGTLFALPQSAIAAADGKKLPLLSEVSKTFTLPSTYDQQTGSSLTWDSAANRLLIGYGTSVAAFDPNANKFSSVAKMIFPPPAKALSAISAFDPNTHTLVVACINSKIQSWNYVLVDVLTGKSQLSPPQQTINSNLNAFQVAWIANGPGGFLSVSYAVLGGNLAFVNPLTGNTTTELLDFSDFAGLGWEPPALSNTYAWDHSVNGNLVMDCSVGDNQVDTYVATSIPTAATTTTYSAIGSEFENWQAIY